MIKAEKFAESVTKIVVGMLHGPPRPPAAPGTPQCSHNNGLDFSSENAVVKLECSFL